MIPGNKSLCVGIRKTTPGKRGRGGGEAPCHMPKHILWVQIYFPFVLVDKLLITANISIPEFTKSNEFQVYTGRIRS